MKLEIDRKKLTIIQEKLLRCLTKHKQMSRKRLSEITGFPMTTIYDNLYKLRKQGIVKKRNEIRETRGRPRVFWYINLKQNTH